MPSISLGERAWLICLALLATSAALGIGELAVRRLELAPAVFRIQLSGEDSLFEPSSNPLLGYTLKANYRSTSRNCHQYFPFTNSDGQRDLERLKERPASIQRRILMLGDSVVAGSGMCDFEKTISRNLERQLSDRNTEVLNFGVPGYNVLSASELLKTKGILYHPDEVLYVYVWNDFVDNLSAVVQRSGTTRPAWLEGLFRHVQIFRLLSLKLNLFEFASDYSPEADHLAKTNPILKSNRARGFDAIQALAAQNHFSVTIVAWPYFSDRSIEEPDSAWSVPPERRIDLASEATQRGFSLIRLSSSFQSDFETESKVPRSHPASPRWVYTLKDGTHPNLRGADLAARLIITSSSNVQRTTAH